MQNFSESCERNKQPIYETLSQYLEDINEILEIGSGSGQHALFFAKQHPKLQWQPSDRKEYLDSLKANLKQHASYNISEPILLDVNDAWPTTTHDAIFTANTLHIMSWNDVVAFFKGAKGSVRSGGLVFIYGPFRFQNEYTSPSNEQFDFWLKARNPESGIRDFEAVDKLAQAQLFTIKENVPMPANNQLLILQRA